MSKKAKLARKMNKPVSKKRHAPERRKPRAGLPRYVAPVAQIQSHEPEVTVVPADSPEHPGVPGIEDE
jgi:hypothetical protein